MRKTIITAAIAAMLGAGAFAAEPAKGPMDDKQIENELSTQYANAKFQKIEEKDVNGVKVEQWKVTDPFGQAIAVVTDRGDILIAGHPQNPKYNVPHPVLAAIDSVFKKKPQHMVHYTVTNYMVDISSNGHEDRIVLDAAGRVRDIKGFRDLKHGDEMAAKEEKINPVDAKRIDDLVHRNWGATSKVEKIETDPNFANFYTVQYIDAANRKCSITTDTNDVFSRRVEIGAELVPPPVLATVKEVFNGDKIVRMYKRTYDYYHLEDQTPGGQIVTMKVGLNGDILSISTPEKLKADEERAQLRQQ